MIDSLNSVAADSPLGKMLRFLMNRIPKNHVTRIRSGINRGARWVVGSSIHRCWLGSYETEMQTRVKELIRPGMLIWDVGANAGFYTLAFSRLTGSTGAVYAFEPLGENVAKLRRHLEVNAAANTHIVQLALSDREGLIGFDTGDSHQKGFLSHRCDQYLVPASTADQFLTQRPDAVPDLVKIDIEGAEADMLEGARQLLLRHRPVVLLALHSPEQKFRCHAILRESGYAIEAIDGSGTHEPTAGGWEILATPVAIPASTVEPAMAAG